MPKLFPSNKSIVEYAALGLSGLTVIYLIIKYGLPAFEKAAAGAVGTTANVAGALPGQALAGIANGLQTGSAALDTATGGAFSSLGSKIAGAFQTEMYAGYAYKGSQPVQVIGLNSGNVYAVDGGGNVIDNNGNTIGYYKPADNYVNPQS